MFSNFSTNQMAMNTLEIACAHLKSSMTYKEKRKKSQGQFVFILLMDLSRSSGWSSGAEQLLLHIEAKTAEVIAASEPDSSQWRCYKQVCVGRTPRGRPRTCWNPLGGSREDAAGAAPAASVALGDLDLDEQPEFNREVDFCQVLQMHWSVLYWQGVSLTRMARIKVTVQMCYATARRRAPQPFDIFSA